MSRISKGGAPAYLPVWDDTYDVRGKGHSLNMVGE